VDVVLDFHVRGEKIKVSRSRCYYDTSYRKKKFLEKYLCWFAHVELYVPYKIMVERMVGSTFSSSNVNEIVNDNNNRYRSMIMDAMRMNQGNACECSIVDEELIERF